MPYSYHRSLCKLSKFHSSSAQPLHWWAASDRGLSWWSRLRASGPPFHWQRWAYQYCRVLLLLNRLECWIIVGLVVGHLRIDPCQQMTKKKRLGFFWDSSLALLASPWLPNTSWFLLFAEDYHIVVCLRSLLPLLWAPSVRQLWDRSNTTVILENCNLCGGLKIA